MSNFTKIRDKIQALRQEHVEKSEELYLLTQEIERVKENPVVPRFPWIPGKEISDQIGQISLPGRIKFPKGLKIKKNRVKPFIFPGFPNFPFFDRLKILQLEIAKLKTILEKIELELSDLYPQFWALGEPQKLIENWKDDYPILLLPIKIETRFIEDDGGSKYLGVRFFPDDIFINTHEKALTPDEITSGKGFWTILWGALGPDQNKQEEEHKGAWRGIAKGMGASRAAYVLIKTKPTNWPVDLSIIQTIAPAFPSLPIKNESWTLPPRTYVLPDKFVVRLYSGGNYREVTAKQIWAYPLILGPDPQKEDFFDKLSEVDGIPVAPFVDVEKSIKWLIDFEEAVSVGMAAKIELSNQEFDSGFDKILVAGLRHTADINRSQKLIEDVIDSHHYGLTGLELLPQGTPTNNTKENPSGFTSIKPDIEKSFENERKDPLLEPMSTVSEKERKDGHWLSYGLGIEEGFLEHIAEAGRSERQEAIFMNKALWPGTLGYYSKEMLSNWFESIQVNDLNDGDLNLIQNFFIDHVSGRGSFPVFRVDNQPYGVIPVSAYSKFKTPEEDSIFGRINDALAFFRESWKKKLTGIKTVNNSSGNWQQDFIDILALHSGSVEYHQRIGLGPLIYFLFLSNVQGNSSEVWFNSKFQKAANTLQKINGLIPASSLINNAPRQALLTWFPQHNKIKGDLISDKPISESKPLDGNYLAFLANPDNTVEIIDNYLSGKIYSNTLLYRMLRHSYLLQIWAILWEKDNEKSWNEKEYLNLFTEGKCQSVWKIYFKSKSFFTSQALPYLMANGRYQDFLSSINKLLTTDANGNLQSLPTARLERLLTEHLDLCSYRLDAWQTGIVDYKLKVLRSQKPKGSYLGAFGWVLDVRRELPRIPETNLPFGFSNDNEDFPLTKDSSNMGFIHAPSIAQATTGAVLRENYISKGLGSMEVNLNSKRVRLAREIIQGLQNGQELAALLGYRFERYLHDLSESTSGEYNKYIYELRKLFPLRTETVDNHNGAVEANNVIHGYNLLNEYKNNPSGILNQIDPVDQNELKKALDHLNEIIDAVSDLTMAEGVHQTILGNHARAGAILNAIGDGGMIPESDFIETPRTGIALTQRMGVCFKALKYTNNPINPWPNLRIFLTPRAKADPFLNEWLGKILGDPKKVQCHASYILDEVTNDETSVIVPLDKLSLQPIDVVFILNSASSEEKSELSRRIAFYIRDEYNLANAVKVKIDFRNRAGFSPDAKTFYELAPLVQSLHQLITESQIMRPDHLQNASSIDNDAGSAMNYDIVELENRLNVVKQGLIDIKTTLGSHNPITLSSNLFKASYYGIMGTIFPSDTPIEQLLDISKRAEAEIAKRESDYLKVMENFATIEANEEKVEILQNAIKAFIGKEIVVLPKFQLNNFDALKSSYQDKQNLLRNAESPLVMEDWLQGVAKVSEKVQNWQLFNVIHEAFSPNSENELVPLQMPYQVNDQWLGIEFDDGDENLNISGDPLSIVLNFPDGFIHAANNYCCGFVIEEWVEKIPSREETTGVTFNYDEPEAEPPQALLLAVPPQNKGFWEWDDLMDTLDETLEMAKMRAIDPDLLGQSPGSEFNPFLPGIMGAITSDRTQTVTLNFNDLNHTSSES